MLRALRNQTRSIFFKCFLVLLICGFALWGVGDITGGNKRKNILTVENDNISFEEVLNEIDRERYLLQKRPSLQEAIKKGLHKKVLKKFEQEILINAEAQHLSLHVPLSEQTNIIKNEKAFRDPLGEFSQKKFLQSLNNAGLSETKYLEMIQSQSSFRQLTMPFMINDHYNGKIIKKIMDWQNEIRDIEYEIFKFVDKKDLLKPSNEVLDAFYQKNLNSYSIPKSRDIKYIDLDPSDFENEVKINKKQIDERYEIEKSNYITFETREILQIITQDELKAKEFVKSIKKGKKFEDLAKNIFNLSKSDTNIGFLKKSELPSESADFVFNSKLNKIIGPIKTKFGYSIYKVINVLPQKQINYDDAINDIKKKLIKELSIEILFEKLDIIEDLIAEGSNLEEIVLSEDFNKKIKIKTLKNVSKQGIIHSYDKNLEFIDKNTDFLNNIWNTEINQLSEIVNSKNDKYSLIEVVKENNKQTPKFDLVKTKVYNEWLEKELVSKSKDNAKTLIISKNNVLSSKTSIKRSDKSFKKIGNAMLINKIFEINDNEIKLLVTNNNILAVKINKSRIDKYDFNKKVYDELNSNLSKSFFNDFSSFYIQNLAIKHKLERNYEELESFFIQSEGSN